MLPLTGTEHIRGLQLRRSQAARLTAHGKTMSRAVLLSLTEAEVLAKCASAKVGVSAIETLHGGGVRLVCMSTAGAELIRQTLKSKLIVGEVTRQRYRPLHSTW